MTASKEFAILIVPSAKVIGISTATEAMDAVKDLSRSGRDFVLMRRAEDGACYVRLRPRQAEAGGASGPLPTSERGEETLEFLKNLFGKLP